MENSFPPPEPQDKKKYTKYRVLNISMAILLALLAVYSLFLLENGNYGWTLFCAIPFSLGLAVGIYTRVMRTKKLLIASLLILLVLSGISSLLLLAGFEGAICILMAMGLILLPAMVGMLLGYLLRKASLMYGLAIILVLNTSAYTYDAYDETGIRSVATETVSIHAPRETVWQVLTHQVRFSESGHFLFDAGMSYPQEMELQQQGDQCVLFCHYHNGSTALPVTKLDSLERIRFSMPEQILTMKELTPHHALDAPHLSGYYEPVYGEFVLNATSATECTLTARTAYGYKITPAFYWRWWTDYITNTMHRQVLADIKHLSEEQQ